VVDGVDIERCGMNVLWGGHADLLELGLTLGLTLNLGLGLIDGLGRILGLWLGLVLECGRGLGWDSLLHLHHLRRWPKLHTEAQTQQRLSPSLGLRLALGVHAVELTIAVLPRTQLEVLTPYDLTDAESALLQQD
jgi:hypothetical protein